MKDELNCHPVCPACGRCHRGACRSEARSESAGPFGSVIPTDEEVLLREAKDAADGWKGAMKANREAWDYIKSEQERLKKSLGFLALFHRPSIPPPLPPPIPTKLRIIAERMGWLEAEGWDG